MLEGAQNIYQHQMKPQPISYRVRLERSLDPT